MRGCAASGALDDTLYTKPLPWIGLYVAAASFLCAAAMAFDAYSGFRRRMLWFPARLFSLNATTITLLGVANKFPVDLNTSMPRSIDQLTKLSGTTLICTVMANFVPSLGMDLNVASDVVAVGILVVTVIVNVCIQMGTGVIYAFLPEHITIMILMMAQLVVLISSAVSVKTTRQILEGQYVGHCKRAYDRTAKDSFSRSNLASYIETAWWMAQNYRPKYGVSEMGSASAFFCLVAAIVLAEAVLRALFMKSSISAFCSGTSDYRWSTTLVLIVQAAAVVIGTVAPVCRWLYRIQFEKVPGALEVEEYWVMRLKGWKTPPSAFQLMMGWGWKIVDRLKNSVLDGLIRLQSRVVLSCKLIHLTPQCLNKGGWLFKPASSPNQNETLEYYVLHVEWERDWGKVIEKSELKDMKKWKRRSIKDRSLVELINEHSTQGFKDVLAFYGARDEPLNCWALPLVTLVSIAVSLPGICPNSVGSLLRGVKLGRKYVDLLDRNLSNKDPSDLSNADPSTVRKETKVAETVWHDLNNHKWFNLDWHGSRLRKKSGKQRIEAIMSDLASSSYRKPAASGSTNGSSSSKRGSSSTASSKPSKSRQKVRASRYMYRACTTILKDYKDQTEVVLFEGLRRAISDMLGACLTNLHPAIRDQCFNTSYYSSEEREMSARNAVSIFGEVEGILDSIVTAPKKGACMENWRI
uniref:DNA translocase FtsK n=1 Tax=Anthurium amnicola TaxID=1678845 RepID=A0A1D1Z8Y7_9ARAE